VIRRVPRRFVALGVAGIIGSAFAAAGCSSTLRDAATISYRDDDGEHVVHVRKDDFEDELKGLLASDQIRTTLELSGDHSIGSDTAAQWLTERINDVAADVEFRRRGLEVTDADRAAARAYVDSVFGPATGADAVGADLRRALLLRRERFEAVARVTREEPTEAEAQALYEANREQIETCPAARGILPLFVPDEATAQQLLQRVQGGESFDSVVGDELVTPQCLDAGIPENVILEATNAADGAVLGPYPADNGAVILQVIPWNPTFEQFRDSILGALREQRLSGEGAVAHMPQVLAERLKDVDVRVDHRYGSWLFDDATQQYSVRAPEPPQPRDQREPDPVNAPVTIPPEDG
jgi:hypothetical protein